jgi:hypothetical protein
MLETMHDAYAREDVREYKQAMEGDVRNYANANAF